MAVRRWIANAIVRRQIGLRQRVNHRAKSKSIVSNAVDQRGFIVIRGLNANADIALTLFTHQSLRLPTARPWGPSIVRALLWQLRFICQILS